MEAAFLKTETSAYLHNVLTDFEEIRHGDATRLFKPDHQKMEILKIQNTHCSHLGKLKNHDMPAILFRVALSVNNTLI